MRSLARRRRRFDLGARLGVRLGGGRCLSARRAQVMAALRKDIFVPRGDMTWEGVEIGAYWETVGKKLMTERLYEKKSGNGNSRL